MHKVESTKPHCKFCSEQCSQVKYFQNYTILVVLWPYPTDVELCTCSIMFSSSLAPSSRYLKSFIYDHVDTELSVIYTVHYPYYGSPYELYLEDQ